MISKDLSQTKKKEEEGSEKKEIKRMKLTQTSLMLCLGLMKTPNRNISILNGCRSVLGLFRDKFQSDFELGLVLRNFYIKEMLGF